MKLNIKPFLEKKNMSRYELAKRIGVTYPTITSIYNGESTSIKFDILNAICDELECTPNDIIQSNSYVSEEVIINNTPFVITMTIDDKDDNYYKTLYRVKKYLEVFEKYNENTEK